MTGWGVWMFAFLLGLISELKSELATMQGRLRFALYWSYLGSAAYLVSLAAVIWVLVA